MASGAHTLDTGARLPAVEAVLDDGVAERAFPGACAEIGRADGVIWHYSTGRLTYDANAAPATADTVFDLASLTKVIATSTIALSLTSSGRLDLEAPVRELVPEWQAADRAAVTVRDLLEHASGLPAHRPYYQTLHGRAQYQRAIAEEPLVFTPRTQSIYSDAGFMLLGFILEDAGGAPLDEQFRRWRDAAAAGAEITYHPPRQWHDRLAPTEKDVWRGRMLVGEVHDENAAALGGAAAHAGLFGTTAATGACARWWLARLGGEDDTEAGITTASARLFAQRTTVPGSSRALGWDTMLLTSSCGSRLSAKAVGHTGFTGTSLWIDPERDLYFVLLTNRVHPTRDNNAIQRIRRAFHDAAMEELSRY